MEMGGGETVYAVQGTYIKSADPGLRAILSSHFETGLVRFSVVLLIAEGLQACRILTMFCS